MTRSIVLMGVASVALAACGGPPKTADVASALVQARIVTVAAAQVADLVELYGTVEAERSAAVSSRVMASVTAVMVRPGDVVRAGQVLVEIDPSTARGQEAQARGALAQAQAALALSERNLSRFKALAAKDAASQLELDLATMQYEQAKGAVMQGDGAVAAAESVAREAKVVAPFAGRVTAKLVEVGDLAAPGRPLVTVESASGRRLVVAVPESVLVASDLKAGRRLAVRIDAWRGAGEEVGTVSEVYPAADPASHTFTVKIAVGAAAPAGAAGRAWLPGANRALVAVPPDAILRSGGLDLIVVRDADGRARSRAVALGSALPDGRIEVLSGVAAGDAVAVGLPLVPPDGTPIEVRP